MFDNFLGVGLGDRDEAFAMGHLDYHAVFFAAKELDVVDVDKKSAMATEKKGGGEGLVDILERVVEDELLLFFAAEIVNVGVVVGSLYVEDIGTAGGEGELATLVEKVDGDVGDILIMRGFAAKDVAEAIDFGEAVVGEAEEDGREVGEELDGEDVAGAGSEDEGEGDGTGGMEAPGGEDHGDDDDDEFDEFGEDEKGQGGVPAAPDEEDGCLADAEGGEADEEEGPEEENVGETLGVEAVEERGGDEGKEGDDAEDECEEEIGQYGSFFDEIGWNCLKNGVWLAHKM